MATVFHAWSYGKFIEIQSNLRRKKLHRTNEGSNFLRYSFSNRDNVRALIQFTRESQPKINPTVFCRSDSSSEANSSFGHGSDCLVTLRVESSIISIDSHITENIIREVNNTY